MPHGLAAVTVASPRANLGYGGFHKWVYPNSWWFIMENPIKVDDLGVRYPYEPWGIIMFGGKPWDHQHVLRLTQEGYDMILYDTTTSSIHLPEWHLTSCQIHIFDWFSIASHILEPKLPQHWHQWHQVMKVLRHWSVKSFFPGFDPLDPALPCSWLFWSHSTGKGVESDFFETDKTLYHSKNNEDNWDDIVAKLRYWDRAQNWFVSWLVDIQ